MIVLGRITYLEKWFCDMPKNSSVKQILARAKELEREYEWLDAIQNYEEALCSILKQNNIFMAAKIQEKIGFCFHRAAMQAKKREQFRERMQHSVDSYKKALKFYQRVSKDQGEPRIFRCGAAVKYLTYWLESDPNEKKRLLDDCLELENRALASFLEAKEISEYARTYNELSLVFFCRIFLEENRQPLKELLEMGLEWGEKAVKKLKKDGELIAGVYFTLATCLSDSGFYLISRSEKIDKYRLKAIDYLNKAARLSEEAGDLLLAGLSHLWLGINKGEEEAARHHEQAFEYGKQTRDNFLKANGLDYLAYNTYWKARARAIEDPEARRELAEEAMKFYEKADNHYKIISFISPRGGLLGPPSGQAEHYYHLALWEPNPKKRQSLLKKAEQLGTDALSFAENSRMPMVIAQVLHVMSKILQAQAQTQSDSQKKRNCLEKALKFRERTIRIQEELTPYFYWNLGVMLNYLAGIRSDLAEIEHDPNAKIELLEKAAQSSKKCLELCGKVMPDFERKGEITLFAPLRDYQETYAALLVRLHKLTNKSEFLKKAIEALKDGIESAEKLDMVSLTAQLYWKIARTQDSMGEHLDSARNFQQASEKYKKAAEKISQLSDFFKDYATYMQAWSEIEKAKYSHAQKQYKKAKEHYEKAANLHKSTERWNYLTLNYLAWARLELAEDRSRAERVQEAIRLFGETAGLFQKARYALRAMNDTIEDDDEKDLAKRLIKALIIRERYSLGRVALEEGKILGRQGKNSASANKYGQAARRFQQVMDIIEGEPSFTRATIVKDRQELTPIIYLSKAWQMMKKAEASASPELYLKAAKLFEEAKTVSINERARLLALGHSHFCRALEAGTRFEESRDVTLYLDAAQYLESAANYYVKAGFEIASEYAIATQYLFDAYIYLDSAKKEADPEKKARYYMVTEKVLQTSIGSFLKAKHPAKGAQVRRLLERVREEKKLAISLSNILNAPAVTSSTSSFVIPTPTEEMAVGLDKFEHAAIQAGLQASKEEVHVGDFLDLRIQITNVGKQAVLLDKIEGAAPNGFELVSKPNYSIVEKNVLDMRGRRLDSFKTEETILTLRPISKGTSVIEPRIVYTDEMGRQSVTELESKSINVLMTVLKDRITTGHEGIDNLLFGGIPEGYAVLLCSPSYDERSLIIGRFLRAGVEERQTTFHITTVLTDMKNLVEEHQSSFYAFICNPQAEQIAKRLPNVFEIKGVENLTDLNIALTTALRKISTTIKAPRRCCIQIVSDVLLQHAALQTRRWLNGLLPELKSKGFTVLAVMDTRMHSSQEVSAILDLFDGEMEVYERKNKRYLRVKRMANQEYIDSELPISR